MHTVLHSRRALVLLAAGGSAALLLGAFAFQYLGGVMPCKLCLWQRWVHAGAVALGALALAWPVAMVTLAGMATALTTAGLGVYHTGVERGWWPGPDSCTGDGGGLAGLSGADLLSTANAEPVVMCDQVAWAMWGLSLPGWNALASLALAGLWLMAVRARR